MIGINPQTALALKVNFRGTDFLRKFEAGEPIFGDLIIDDEGNINKGVLAALVAGHLITHEVDSSMEVVTEGGLFYTDGKSGREERVAELIGGTGRVFGIPDVILRLDVEDYLGRGLDQTILAAQHGDPAPNGLPGTI